MARLPASLHFSDQLMLTTECRHFGNDVDAYICLVPNDTNI